MDLDLSSKDLEEKVEVKDAHQGYLQAEEKNTSTSAHHGTPLKVPRKNQMARLQETTTAEASVSLLDSVSPVHISYDRRIIEERCSAVYSLSTPSKKPGYDVSSEDPIDPIYWRDENVDVTDHEIIQKRDLPESRPLKAIRKLRTNRLNERTSKNDLGVSSGISIVIPKDETFLPMAKESSNDPFIEDEPISEKIAQPAADIEVDLPKKSGRSASVESMIDRSEVSPVQETWRTPPLTQSQQPHDDRNKGRRSVLFIKSSLEKKMQDTLERLVEDRVVRTEKIWEEMRQKYPWLQPIDAWISEHRRSSRNDRTVGLRRYSGSDTEIDRCVAREEFVRLSETVPEEEPEVEPSAAAAELLKKLHEQLKLENERGANYDFKYTVRRQVAVDEDDGEDEEKLESRVLEKTEKMRQARQAGVVFNSDGDRNVASRIVKNTDDILQVKEVKHHELFDKLKDGLKEKMDDIQRYFLRTNRLADVNRKLKSQIWSSVVTIVLVEAKNLLPMDIDGLSDPYVKFRLGTEKYKSKVSNKTLNPVWLEQFDLHLYEDPYLGQELEVTVWDRDRSHQDDLMGRTVIDLATLERETTHRLWRELEDGSGSIFLLLTISGTTASETISDLAAHEETPQERGQLLSRYSLVNSLQRPRDVGHLIVKVYRGQGLAAADLGGKSDPFCVLELVNARLQTQTEYKTLAPNWQKIFTFNVKDINSVLEVTVYDEDRDHKVEFLGKVAIPLLRIRNGEKRWYALKDKKLRCRAKGNCPQILLELTVVWNIFRACIRTLNPKEKKYMEPEVKFKRQVFLRNVFRLKAIIIIFIDIGKYIQSCWEWESKIRSILALVFFVLACYYFEPWMLPAAAILIILKYYLVAVVTGAPLSSLTWSHYTDHDGTCDDGPSTPGADDDDDDEDKDKEEKKSLKERLQAIQEVTQTVQNSIGYLASLAERVKNLFNFTVPYLSYLAMILALVGCAVLYFIPVRYLILAWGVNKFSRKILRPHSVPNNEVLDLISRVPDDEELLSYRELKPIATSDCDRGASMSSPGSSGTGARREQRKKHKGA
ncbi:multiple C2 and transmembrane domain-containing protein isoform X1 [Prorops nasuta]|uniref:multiple C2 and transmembrane domain-containing protein isoform X1 n=1 Tax=Prorops nasuta TaxID=863751 RepID=UPI0034CFD62C